MIYDYITYKINMDKGYAFTTVLMASVLCSLPPGQHNAGPTDNPPKLQELVGRSA